MIGGLSGSDSDNSEAMLVKFQQAILKLPEKQRMVFNLRYYDELSYEEIGQILDSSVNTLKTNYHYASEKIKQYLIEHAS
jgi:RNA polymerase sigma-70 factor (ECF subfamily)